MWLGALYICCVLRLLAPIKYQDESLISIKHAGNSAPMRRLPHASFSTLPHFCKGQIFICSSAHVCTYPLFAFRTCQSDLLSKCEQAQNLTKTITTAWRRGRVDAVIQSTDKNFMVPVGGAGTRYPPMVFLRSATEERIM